MIAVLPDYTPEPEPLRGIDERSMTLLGDYDARPMAGWWAME